MTTADKTTLLTTFQMEFEKIKIGLWGAALGAFVLFGVGFGMGGWVLGGTAQQRVETAVVDQLADICVAQLQQDPLKDQKVAAFSKLPYDKRGAFVESQGWATMPGASKPNGAVAERCGDRINR